MISLFEKMVFLLLKLKIFLKNELPVKADKLHVQMRGTCKRRSSFSGGSRKKYWGAGPSSFRRQQRLSEIIIEPIKIGWGPGQDFWGPVPPGPNIEPPQ